MRLRVWERVSLSFEGRIGETRRKQRIDKKSIQEKKGVLCTAIENLKKKKELLKEGKVRIVVVFFLIFSRTKWKTVW